MSYGLISIATTTEAAQVLAPPAPVEPGKPYLVSVNAGWWSGVGSATTTVSVAWYSDHWATSLIRMEQVGQMTVSGAPELRKGIARAPNDAMRARVVVDKFPDQGTRIAVFDPIVRRAVDDDLIYDASGPYVPPDITAVSAALVYRSQSTGDITLFSKAPGTAIPPASLTKIVSVMVALDVLAANSLDWTTHQITVQAEDATAGSGNNLLTGDVITMRDAFANMMIPSSNVTAAAVAREMGTLLLAGAGGDPVARFVTEMNTKTQAIGATATVFKNPHGLAASGQVTTAQDYALITFAATDYAAMRSVWGLSEHQIEITGVNARVFFVTSSIPIIVDRDVLGGKSGTLAPTVYNVALHVAMPNGNRAAVVVLKASTTGTRYTDARAIIDAVRWGHQWPAMTVPT